VVSDRLDLASELAVPDRRGEHAMPPITDTLGEDRLAEAELGPHGDLAEPLGLAREQSGGAVLIGHHERRAEPAGRLGDRPRLVGIADRVEARAESEPELLAARVEVGPDRAPDEARDPVGDPGE